MQLDVDKVIENLQTIKADSAKYEWEQIVDGKKYTIKIEIQTQ